MISAAMSEPTSGGRDSARLAWTLWALSVVVVALSAALPALNHRVADASPYWLNNAVAALSCSTVGTLIASRRPKNLIGWLIGAAGLLYAANVFAYEYGTYVLVTGRRSLPRGTTAIWLASWLYMLGGNVLLYSFMLFPDGRLPSPRWRIVAWPTALCLFLSVAQYALAPGPL